MYLNMSYYLLTSTWEEGGAKGNPPCYILLQSSGEAFASLGWERVKPSQTSDGDCDTPMASAWPSCPLGHALDKNKSFLLSAQARDTNQLQSPLPAEGSSGLWKCPLQQMRVSLKCCRVPLRVGCPRRLFLTCSVKEAMCQQVIRCGRSSQRKRPPPRSI